MGKRKIETDQNETPLLKDAMASASNKEDSASEENLGQLQSLRHPSRYGRVYSRRKLGNKSTVSTSPSNVTNQDDKNSNLKFDCQGDFHAGLDTGSLKKTFCGPERSRVSSMRTKMVCGLCEKPLKRKPIVIDNSVALDDVSVVAVLICGHVYHSDCLEPRTSVEDRSDPSCPLCVQSLSQCRS